MLSLDDFGCDNLESSNDFILTRCFQGEKIYVWRYKEGHEELEWEDEIDLESLKKEMGEVIDFKMQGNI